MLEIEAAQQLAIRFDSIGIVDVAGLQERQKPGGGRLDDILAPGRRIDAIADEIDFSDPGLPALGDFKHQIDAIVREWDDLRLDADIETAAAAIDIDQTRHVRLHERTRQRAALLRLDFRAELLVLDLFVALECDAVDHRVLDYRDDQPPALDRGTDLLEQAGGVKPLDTLVDLKGVESAARAGLEIGTDGIGLDPLVALHHDRADLGIGRAHGDRGTAGAQ